MNKAKILVVGATGTVGSEIVRLLKKDGHSVRSTTSRKVEAFSDQVHLNLVTGEGIKAAMEGVDKAFFLSPPGHADQFALLSPLIQEAKRRGLSKVVLMTAMGADADPNSPFRRAEIELERSGLNYNILRPNWFLQNFNSFWVHGIRNQKKILLPAGSAKVSFIDARDIAAVAAKLLTSDEYPNQAFDLTGPEAVDHVQAAAAISKATGLNVTYQEIAPHELRQGLVTAGLPSAYVDFLLVIFGYLREGYNAAVNGNVEKVTGKRPRAVENYAADYKQAWI